MIAAFGDLYIAVVARGEFEPGFGNEVDEGVGDRRSGLVDRSDDFLILLRPGDREHLREAGADDVGFLAHAAGDDDPAILGDGLADRLEALLLGGIEEAAGVDQHDVRAGIIGRHVIAVGAQLGHDPLAVDQSLGTAERDQPDARGLGERGDVHRKARANIGILRRKLGG